jgi:ferric-dicitrate binding protein FerR (iron transport regulator)
MNERLRTAYWQQLSSEQQAALVEALDALRSSTPQQVPSGPADARKAKGSSGRTLAVGCLGMILGCLLTVAVEVMLVLQGVQMVGDAITQPSRPSRTTVQSEPLVVDCNDPVQVAQHESQCAHESQLRRQDDEEYGTQLEPR